MLLLSVLSASPIVPITVFIIMLVLIIACSPDPRAILSLTYLVYPLIFAAVSCIFIALFFGNGTPLTEIAFPWFNWIIYNNGITIAFITFFRVLGAVSALFFLVLTTTMNDLFISLRKIHIPKVLIEISLLIYRYIFVFHGSLLKNDYRTEATVGTNRLAKTHPPNLNACSQPVHPHTRAGRTHIRRYERPRLRRQHPRARRPT